MEEGLIVSISGVRGIVGKTLTAEIVLKWALAYGMNLRCNERGHIVAVGRDTRPSGEMLKCAAIAGLLSSGCDVIDVGIVPTPTLQLYIREHTDGGIGITASHNPQEWNALKFFRRSGMYIDENCISSLKELVCSGTFSTVHWDEVGKLYADASAPMAHVEAISSLISVDEIRRRKFRVAVDCVNGAGSVVVIPLLERLGCEVIPLNCDLSGTFVRSPEPTRESLAELSRLVHDCGADVGFGFDADADRVVIVADGGIPLSEEMTLCIAVEHVLSKHKGKVVTNFSTTMAIDDIANSHGCEVIRTPVGDLNVSAKLMEVNGVIGGEGNGGVIYPPLQCSRDGPCAMALILEFMAERKKPLSHLIATMPRYGMVKRKFKLECPMPPDELKCIAINVFGSADQMIDADGIKLIWHMPKRWVHIRRSGTEDVIRIIAEAEDEKDANELCEIAQRAFLERISNEGSVY